MTAGQPDVAPQQSFARSPTSPSNTPVSPGIRPSAGAAAMRNVDRSSQRCRWREASELRLAQLACRRSASRTCGAVQSSPTASDRWELPRLSGMSVRRLSGVGRGDHIVTSITRRQFASTGRRRSRGPSSAIAVTSRVVPEAGRRAFVVAHSTVGDDYLVVNEYGTQ